MVLYAHTAAKVRSNRQPVDFRLYVYNPGVRLGIFPSYCAATAQASCPDALAVPIHGEPYEEHL
jgi:hypothetical protein